jgi:20S proteasome subunit beta 2
MGSGSLNAMAVFESGYRDDMAEQDAVDLVVAAIRSGIYNDLGSGSNVDICVITKDGVDYRRNLQFLQEKTYARAHPQRFAPGTTTVLKERVYDVRKLVTVVDEAPEAMEL